MSILNERGDFILRHAQRCPEIYFPLTNECGMMSSVTPLLAGDCKTGQNTFLLAPASAETLHESRASRNFWVSIDGTPWSVTGQSAPQQGAQFTPEEEEAVLTGGLLWQNVSRTHASSGLRADVLSFVPAGGERVEIMQVTFTNNGDAPLSLSPTAAVPIYGRSADNIRDHRHVTSLLHRVELRPHGLDVTPTLTFDERGHQLGQTIYRVWGGDETGAPPAGFVPLVRDFVGQGSYDWPEAVVCPQPGTWLHAGQSAQEGEVVAALFFPTVTLLPGQRRRYQIVLAVDDSPAPHLTPDAVSAALERTKAWWQAQVGQTFRTGDAAFDAWMRWVAVQPLLRRIYGCSFLPHHDYGRGGRGWRDLWQDSLALLLTGPEKVRDDLLSYFAGVRADGTNATIIGARPGEFKADRNNIPRVWMDHGFWPLLTTALYLDETGDDGFLLEQQPYFSDCLPHRGEGAPREVPAPARSGTVLEHLLIQLTAAFFDVGEHSHMRLRGADWNDALDMAAERGESVRMMLTGQVFAILSGTADEARTREIIRAADWYLCDPNRGGYCLNTDFGEVKLDMGRMFGFAYGNKENGAVFCHMAVMYAYALYTRGFADEGWRVLELLYRQSADFARSELLPGIPEYFDDRGRGMYPYLTGAGSWLLLTLQTQAFGVRGLHGDLLLEPKLTAAQFDGAGTAEISCTAAGYALRVRYENPQRLDWGEYQIGMVQCGSLSWTGCGASRLIPRKALPRREGPLELTITLTPKGEEYHV